MIDLQGARILQVIPALDAGGAERTTIEISRAIVDANGKAMVASRGGRLTDELDAIGASFFQLPVDRKNPFDLVRNVYRLAALIKRYGIQLVHVRSRAPAWSALFAAQRCNIPLVATYHGAYSASSFIKNFYNSSMTRGDLVIANSQFTARTIRNFYGVPEQKIAIIPRGADLDRFNPKTTSAERVLAARRAIGVEADKAFLFLLPGRLTEWKGQRLAIDAFQRFLQDRPDRYNFLLALIGDEQGRHDYREALLRKIDGYGLNAQILIPGHFDDMPAAYLAADIILAPSLRPEAFGRVSVEAGAMGLPVIAAAHGGAMETVKDGETGFLFPPGDTSSLKAAMDELAWMSRRERENIGVLAQHWVKKRYSSAAMAKSTLAAYGRLLLISDLVGDGITT